MPVLGVGVVLGAPGGMAEGVGSIGGIGGLHMKNEDSLLQSTLENSRRSIAITEHELRSMVPKLVPHLAARCLYGGISELRSTEPEHWSWTPDAFNGGISDYRSGLTQRLTKWQADLRCLYWRTHLT